jgi:site-specific DNA-adenine methylase
MESQLKKIDEAANNWNRTKDTYYKELWYKLIEEFANGPNNIERRVIPINTCHKRNNGKYKINRSSWLNLL